MQPDPFSVGEGEARGIPVVEVCYLTTRCRCSQTFKSSRRVFTCVLRAPEMANLTDAADPAVHLLLRFGHQVESAKRRLHHKEVLPVEVPLYPELPVQHLHLALLQVDDADRLLGVLALIVLQHVGVAAHATPPQHEPAFPPRLQENGTNSCLLDFILTLQCY